MTELTGSAFLISGIFPEGRFGILDKTGAVDTVQSLRLMFYETLNRVMERLLKDNETWLTSKSLAELFEVEVELIESYINILVEAGELDDETTIRKYEIVENGVQVELYSFEVILALGYRIESRVGISF
ncbi:MAG: hypothetical protein ACRDD6_13020 [Tannerellaceae bacterium]